MAMMNEIWLEEELTRITMQVTPEFGETLSLVDRSFRTEYEYPVGIHYAAAPEPYDLVSTPTTSVIVDIERQKSWNERDVQTH